MLSTVRRESNAIIALALREVTNMVRNPIYIVFTLIFPVIFLGLLGSTMSQNLNSNPGFDLLRFMFIGMLASSLYQGAMNGMITLVEDRENDFTQEIFVTPISRYSIMVGKAIGSSLVSLVGLVGLILTALAMGISMQPSDFAYTLLLTPILTLNGAALGVLFIGFVQNPKVAGVAGFLLVFPQMFLSGALIPIAHSTGVLAFIVHIVPMTYLIDLERNLFYHNDQAAQSLIQYSLGLDLLVTLIICVAFIVIGTIMFTRSERNR
jgi:ABC-2 type transport system permease protein